MGELTCDGLASRPGEVEILLAASWYRNRDKHRVSLGSKASHFLYMIIIIIINIFMQEAAVTRRWFQASPVKVSKNKKNKKVKK